MASITSTGIGSGLDVQSLVQQLVAAEGQPTEFRIARQEARYQSELSAFGSLKSALSGFKAEADKMSELATLQVRSAAVGNEEVIAAVVDETALPGNYDVEVQQLAQSEQLQSGQFASATTAVGTGTLTISVGGSAFSIEIAEGANTLSDIQDAINSSVSNTGVSAAIVNADDGSYLILTGDATGASQLITVNQSGGDGGLSALAYDPGSGLNALTQTRAPQDSIALINGFTITSSGNTIEGAIEGVSIDLLSSNVGAPTTLSISNDRAAVKAQLDAFVNAYNELIDAFEEQTAFDAEAETAAPLLGDLTVRSLRDQLRRELFTDVTDIEASFTSLIDIGITTDLNGKLTIDSTKVDAALDGEFAKFGQLFANSDGYAVRLANVVDQYVDETDGILTERVDGLEASIDDLQDQREALALRLESVEARLLRQFNALDTLVSELSSTSNFLTQQLSQLPKIQVNRND